MLLLVEINCVFGGLIFRIDLCTFVLLLCGLVVSTMIFYESLLYIHQLYLLLHINQNEAYFLIHHL